MSKLHLMAALCISAFYAFGWCTSHAGQTEQHLTYGTTIKLSGTLTTESFFGPPNFGETPSADKRETALIMKLDAPIDVAATARTGPDQDSYTDEHRVELMDDYSLGLPKFVGRHVTVFGKLYNKVRVTDLTDVVMVVHSMSHQPGLN